MHFNKTDLVRPENICALGKRQSLQLDNTVPTWEVYACLSSGTDFLFGVGGSEEEAEELLGACLWTAAEHAHYFVTTLEESAYVNIARVVKWYVDAQGESFAAYIEDTSGRAWKVDEGTHEECASSIRQLSDAIAILEGDT